MTTPKPLSFKLKLVLAYVYLGIAGSVLTAASLFFGADQIDKASELADPTNRAAAIIVCLILATISAVMAFLLHKRKKITPIAFTLFTVATYGLGGIPGIAAPALSLDTLITIIATCVDLVIVAFLLLSKEAASQLKAK